LSVVGITAIALAISYQQGLLPVQGTSAQNIQEDWAQGATGSADLSINFDSLRLLFANVAPNQRAALLDDEAAFGEFVKSIASQKSLLAAAKSNNLDQEPNINFLMRRSAENTLMELYLNRLISNKIPTDFPTEEQISEYFENNKDNLVVEERVSVWQIFIPTPQGTSDEQISEIQSQAIQIVSDIRAGRTDFTNAALTYSSHQPSKLNGGYMGILKISELIPGIHEPLLALEEGEISEPIKSEMGFHILRRDQVIPSQPVTLEQVRPQIRNLLVNQLRARLQNEIIELATNTYPVEYQEDAIKEWRNILKNSN
jgi:parvulin-like peptidyl-prolyl isomerase